MPQVWEYRFTVTGRGRFPLDMLRYDWARPAQSADSRKIEESFNQENHDKVVEITLVSMNKPAYGRWESFGWIVVQGPEKVKVQL